MDDHEAEEAANPKAPSVKEGAAAAVLELRQRERTTQKELAKKLEVSLKTLTRVETGGKPLSKNLCFKLGLLAEQRGYGDLANVFRNYLSPGRPFSSLEFVSQPAINAKQAMELRHLLEGRWEGYSQIAQENLGLAMSDLEGPTPDVEAAKVGLHVVRTALEQQTKLLDRVSELLKSEGKD